MSNIYEIDASNLDGTGHIVPIELSGADSDDRPYALDHDVKEEWAIKVYNNADQDVDATPLISTSDDGGFAEYDAVDALTTTVTSGGAVPGSVELLDSDLVGGYIALRLTAAATPVTGTIKVVFQSRKMGAN